MSGSGQEAGPGGFTPVDPYALARAEAKATELKRFFKDASVAERPDGFALLLDGREARTPARRPIVVPTAAAASLLAAEWDAQGEVIRPGTMPAMRLANSVIDGVAQSPGPVLDEVVRYAGSDLLCYRAEAPEELAARQAAAWDPVLAWARDAFGARFTLAAGVMHVAQPEAAVAAVRRAVEQAVGQGAAAPFRLGALHMTTTLTGSALLALAVLAGRLPAAEAWAATHVDEDYQIERWGDDEEAAMRRERRWADMQAADALAAAVVKSR